MAYSTEHELASLPCRWEWLGLLLCNDPFRPLVSHAMVSTIAYALQCYVLDLHFGRPQMNLLRPFSLNLGIRTACQKPLVYQLNLQDFS